MPYQPPYRAPNREPKPRHASIPARMPSVSRQAWNLAKAAGTVMYSFLAGARIRVPNEVYEERIAICRTCPKFDVAHQKCTLCGCHARVKLWVAQFFCPHNPPKWGVWVPPEFTKP